MALERWIKEPTDPEEHAFKDSWNYVMKTRDWEGPGWQLISHLKNYYASGFRGGGGDYREHEGWHKGAFNKQNVLITRYAFYTEIPTPDVTLTLKTMLEEEIDFQFKQIEIVLAYSGEVRYTSRDYLKTALGLTQTEAEWWLKVLVYLTLRRYDFDMVHHHPDAWTSKVDVIALYPWLTVFWEEITPEFYDMAAEKTGLAGDELQDKVDEIIFEATSSLKIAQWIEMMYRIAAERKAKNARFRLYMLIVMGVLVALPAILAAFTAAASAVTTSTSMCLSVVGKIQLFAQVFVGSLSLSLNALLVAIHFDTLVGVHKIALLVSEDYRLIMSEVYGEIRRVSSALGYGPEFLLLLTQNSKKLIQDVGSTFGREWDMTEVQWLSTFQDYMGKFQGAAYRYRDNPEAVLYDVGRWVEQPAVNTKGAFMAKLIKSVDDTVEKTEEIVGDIVTVRKDINKLVKDLPEDISKQIAEAIDPYVSKFDDFIVEKYDPGLKAFNEVFDTIKAHQAEIRDRAEALANRLKKPADYLLEIDTFTDEDRLDQETKFDDLSSRYYKRQLIVRSEALEPFSAELGKIREAMTRPLEIAFMGVEEVTAPVPIPIGEIDPSKTWFVGEY